MAQNVLEKEAFFVVSSCLSEEFAAIETFKFARREEPGVMEVILDPSQFSPFSIYEHSTAFWAVFSMAFMSSSNIRYS